MPKDMSYLRRRPRQRVRRVAIHTVEVRDFCSDRRNRGYALKLVELQGFVVLCRLHKRLG